MGLTISNDCGEDGESEVNYRQEWRRLCETGETCETGLIPNVPVGEEVLSNANDGFMIGLLGAVIGIYLLLKLMVKTKFWKQLTAPGSQKKEDGYTNSFGWESLIDQVGEADTDLHPSGWVIVESKRFFMISEGDFIEKGSSVKVLSVDGNRIVVKKL